MFVSEDAELTGKSLANCLDMGGTGQGHRKPARGAHRQPPVFVVRQAPIRMTLLIGQRRQNKAILQGGSTRQ